MQWRRVCEGALLASVALTMGCSAKTQVDDSGVQRGDSGPPIDDSAAQVSDSGPQIGDLGTNIHDSDDSNRPWSESSTELIIETRSSQDGAFGGASGSKYSCVRYPRSQMSDEQLAYLRTLQPAETSLSGMCDASRTTEVTIVDASSSWKTFKTSNSTTGCHQSEVAVTVPATILVEFPKDGLPCVPCYSDSPCSKGVCANSVCVN